MDGPEIVSLGEVLWDLFPEGARFGGAPANFACHAAALGGDVTMVSAVGRDAYGKEVIEILQSYGIHTDLIQAVGTTATGTVGIELDERGKPTFNIHGGSAWDEVTATPELEARLQQADAIYFGTLGQRSEISRSTIRHALAFAGDRNIRKVLDVNLRLPFYDEALIRDSVELASILKLSDDELKEDCEACGVPSSSSPEIALSQLRQRFDLDLVVMTCGAAGALLVSSAGTVEQAGFPSKVRDTVGAGDSFTAAFLIGLLHGDDYETILRDACKLAAEVCSQPGAIPDPVASATWPC